tara:strand:+ start:78 stop:1136 length:1059 start_codon:yes stop_codon:yes gene_type:complete
MAYTTIDKSTLHFNTKLWTGTGSSNAITGVGFQPDFCWVKMRSGSENHFLTNAIQGATKIIQSDTTAAEQTSSNGMTAFNADGFTVNTDTGFNGSGDNYVAWNWKANGAGSANTDGSINTIATSVNTTAGFSICKWTGTGANATIGHGLGVVPQTYFVKNLSATNDWNVYHHNIGNTHRLFLNTTAGDENNDSAFNDTSPTSTVFSVGTNTNVNQSGSTMIAFVFAEKKGYSKFGTYNGNGNANGPYVYTGFKPAFVLWKRSDSANGWILMDNKRPTVNSVSYDSNPVNYLLEAQSNGAEASASSYYVDYLSNGFKVRNTNNVFNNNGAKYLYWAFAAAPLVGSNNVPCTAR